MAPVSSFDEAEKAAAAKEARDAVGSTQRRSGSRTDEVEAALMHYLATEQYHERGAPPHATEDDEPEDPDEL